MDIIGPSEGLVASSILAGRTRRAESRTAQQQRCNPSLGGDLYRAAFTHGATTAFFWCSMMLFTGALISLFFNRIRHEDLGNAEHGVEQEQPVVAAH